MHSEILIPNLPESTINAEVSRIYVNEGQAVSSGEVLFDVETDKVVLEVPAPDSGIIEKFNVSLGEQVISEQVAMLLRKQLSTDNPEEPKEKEQLEYTQEKVTEVDSDPTPVHEFISHSLFDKRGIICGLLGLIIGAILGVLGTTIVLG